MYFNIIQNIIENFLDYYFELPEFDIDDDDFEQTAPEVISYYKKTYYDEDEYINIIII